MNKLKFEDLSLSSEMHQAITDLGFVEASPIQSQAIPYIMAGRDVVGQAQTGTGKTAAFGIPTIETIDELDKSPQALILCPTRELALQVSEEFKKLAKYKRDIRIAAIYGGESIERQIKALKGGVQIIIGTPGRVMDHMERRTLRLDKVRTIVLDEADEMLDMGFREDIEFILSHMPEERQTIFFSATMSKEIMALTRQYQTNPELVKIERNELTTPTIEQLYYEIRGSKQKIEAFSRLVEFHDLKLMLVFCNTKRMVDELVEDLQGRGYSAEGLHGDLRQAQRNAVMSRFRSGTVNILVATDVAARGIDVDNVDAVFNFDLPLDEEYYVHRIGRTGRAGRSGTSFTFISSGKEVAQLRDIQRYTKAKIEKGEIPSFKQIAATRKARFADKVKAGVVEGNLEQYSDIVDQLLFDGFEAKDIIAALIKMNIGDIKSGKEDISFGLGDRGERGGRDRDRDRGDRYDRGERSDRGDRGSFGGGRERERRGGYASSANSNMVRLFINIGKSAKVRPGDIVGAITGETNLPGNKIGAIDIFDKFSFVEVPNESVKEVIHVMDNNQIKGKRINIEIAR